MDATTVVGGITVLVERRRYIAESRVVDMMERLHVDLFLLDRFLLNGLSVKIRFVRSKDAFSLIAGGQSPRLQGADSGRFAVRTQGCDESDCSNGSHKSFGKRDSQLSDTTRGPILQGAMLHMHDNLFLATLILRCIDNDAYNGEYSNNQFNTNNNSINFLAVYVDGRHVPV